MPIVARYSTVKYALCPSIPSTNMSRLVPVSPSLNQYKGYIEYYNNYIALVEMIPIHSSSNNASDQTTCMAFTVKVESN